MAAQEKIVERLKALRASLQVIQQQLADLNAQKNAHTGAIAELEDVLGFFDEPNEVT